MCSDTLYSLRFLTYSSTRRELGGDSLIAVRLFAKIKKTWGVEYPITWARQRWAWETRSLGKKKRELTPAEFRSTEIETAFAEACTHYQHKPYPDQVELFCPPPQVRILANELGACSRKAQQQHEASDG